MEGSSYRKICHRVRYTAVIRPTTVLEALSLYAQSLPEAKRDKDISNLKSALKKCVLPGYNFSATSFNTKTGLNQCLSQLSLKDFRKARIVFKRVGSTRVKDGEILQSTFNNYYSHLNCFLRWLRSQHWYSDASGPLSQIAPPLYSGHSIEPGQLASTSKANISK